MAVYGSSSVTVNCDDAGGTSRNMTQHTLDINGIEIETILEETHAFGDAWVESLAVGLRRMMDVVLGGLYDDTTTTGPDAVYSTVATGPTSTTRTFQVVYGAAKSTSAETHARKYRRILTRGQLHKYEATLNPTGVVTEA